jgi:hypothetical protein
MSFEHSFVFPLGVTISVVTDSGAVFVGTLLGIRHHDDAAERGVQYLFIQLTSAVGPYSVGEVVALNETLVVSVGPVSVL